LFCFHFSLSVSGVFQRKTEEEMSSCAAASIPCHADIVIIGGGVSGASAAYHLAQVVPSTESIVILERGRFGEGSNSKVVLPGHVPPNEGSADLPWAHASGTAVMEAASTIKMMTQLFASNSTEFIRHHGVEGVRRYLRLANRGLAIEKSLARSVLPDAATQIRELGAMYLARDPVGAEELRHEYETLKACGAVDIEWWDKDKVSTVPDCPVGTECAMYLANDAIINSQEFAKNLLRHVQEKHSNVRVFEGSPDVSNVWTDEKRGVAITELSTGARIVSKHAVVATGGLSTLPALSGIMKPCWSYLVSVPHPDLHSNPATLAGGVSAFSPNMYTWGFTHDWCWTNGGVRCSGEDHFSALKPPRNAERCNSLAQWVRESYPHVYGSVTADDLQFEQQYGVYSETPDSVPIIGTGSPTSRVCYVLGCNAWGQAALSYSASLVPGLLQYTELTAEQKDILNLISIRRFGLLYECQN
jgi:glycine/D-amino acid oxidase-like deaminating enzyme